MTDLTKAVATLTREVMAKIREGEPSGKAAADIVAAVDPRLVRGLAAELLAQRANERLQREQEAPRFNPPPPTGPRWSPPPRREQTPEEKARFEALVRRNEEEAAARRDKISADIKRHLDDFTRHLKSEWTRELLEATFTTPDGREVRWGEATAAEHREGAEASLDSAIRHTAAAREIEAAGVNCLNETVS